MSKVNNLKYSDPEPRSETPVSPLQTAFPLPPSSHSSWQLHRQAASLQLQTVRGDAFNVNHAPHFSTPTPTKTMSRSPSLSSYSNATNQPATPANVYPPPAYVAPFGASQVVSDAKRRFSDDEDNGGRGVMVKSLRDDMQFSAAALALVNAFLDQLLYSFLANAKSTSLTALRPAVVEVLKLRLASEAIASAEEELSELLAGGEEEEEEMNQRQTAAEHARRWDTELVWKRTRLRVMVYIRLGEMEDDDEERYVREDDLFHNTDRRFSHSSGLVSWAAAIFLTSVLEYVAEQVLQVAGKAAESRARRQSRITRTSVSASGLVTPIDGVTVEDFDTEKVALNSTLGRLWRTWRKSLRINAGGNGGTSTPTNTAGNSHHNNNNSNYSRRLSRDFNGTVMSPRRSSFGAGAESVSAVDDSRSPSTTTADDRDASEGGAEEVPEAQYPEHVLAANIPLPMDDEKRDVDEIEVPGLARDPDQADADGDRTPLQPAPKRRNSLTGSAPLSFIASVVDRLATSNELDFGFDEGRGDSDMSADQTHVADSEAEVSPVAKDMPVAAEEFYTPRDEKPSLFEEDPTDSSTEDAVSGTELAAEDGEPAVKPQDVTESEEKSPEAEEPTVVAPPPTVYVATRHRSHSVPKHFLRAPPVERKVEAEPAELRKESEEPAIGQAAEAGEAAEADTDSKPEQKANAAEMASIKREASSESKAALDKATNESQAPAEEATKKEAEPSTTSPGSVAGAVVAGSAAAAAAAVATVYGKDSAQKEPVDQKEPDQKEAAKRDVVKLIKSGHFELPPDTDTESARVEERDNQKHLVEVKQFGVRSSSKRSAVLLEQPNTARRLSLDHASSSPNVSEESFSLDDGAELRPPVAQQQHMASNLDRTYSAEEQVADIGVARTSDTAVRTSRADVPQEEFAQARDTFTNPNPKRRSRIVISTSVDEGQPVKKDSPPVKPEAPESTISPQGFLERRSLTPKPLPLQVKPSHPPDLTLSSGRPSPIATSSPTALSAGHRSPNQEKASSPFRQFFSAAVKDSSSWPKKPASALEPAPVPAVPVQEHQYVQQKNGSNNKRDSRYKEEPADKSLPLTSASIKGPEDFEMFVQGGDTVKYTLTPVSVRDDTSAVDAPSYMKVAVARPVERGPSPTKKPTPPAIDTEDTRTGRSQRSKQATSANNEAGPKSPSTSEKRRSISRPPVRNTSVHKRSGLTPREPQILTESTRDFADFIRSTGPSKEPEIRPIVHRRSTTSLSSLRDAYSASLRSQSPGARSSRSMSRSHIQAKAAPPLPPMPDNKNISHMQPRGAQTNVTDGTSELIDFIRTGPNGVRSGEDRQHRIPRAVAPFRTTMDSEQLNEWGARVAVQPDLKLNTNVPVSSITPSVRSATSANSRSALLQDVSHPAFGEQPTRLTPTPARTNVASQGESVTKTRFRNKDPYAIDYSDEEDDDLLTALPKKQRPEESLIDFLRNSEPPDTNNPHSDSSKKPGPIFPPRRESAPGFKTLGADAVSMGRRGPSAARDGPQAAPAAPLRTGNTSIAVGPITTSRQKLEARENGTDSGKGTLELADFLRSSRPTEAPRPPRSTTESRSTSKTSAPPSTSSKKSFRKTLFGAFFGGGKGRKTYLDM